MSVYNCNILDSIQTVPRLLVLSFILASVSAFHDDTVDEFTCVRCNQHSFCVDNQHLPCPHNSTSIPDQFPSAIEDCICDPGFNRSAHICVIGTAPYYYFEGLSKPCPVFKETRYPLAFSLEDCGCIEGYRAELTWRGPCVECSPSTFNSHWNSTVCLHCPTFSNHHLSGSTNIVDCVCDPGYTGNDGGPCAECSGGFFKAASGSASCEACAPNTYSNGTAATHCTECHENSNTLAHSTYLSDCLCLPGFEPNGPNECRACPAGKFKNATENIACTQCLAGQYENETGATACRACNLNSIPTPERTGCLCQKGFSAESATNPNCEACALGLYKDEAGNFDCTHCPDDQHTTHDVGRTAIAECSCIQGFSGDFIECTACLPGTYKNFTSVESEDCDLCPQNTHSPSASVLLTDCICNAGYTGADGDACVGCALGKFKDVNGSASCTNCLEDTYQNTTAQTVCFDCVERSTTEGLDGQDSVEDCICRVGSVRLGTTLDPFCSDCEPGEFATADGCQNCSATSYTTGFGSTECIPCPNTSVANAQRTGCVCKAGHTCTITQQIEKDCVTVIDNNIAITTLQQAQDVNRALTCGEDSASACSITSSWEDTPHCHHEIEHAWRKITDCLSHSSTHITEFRRKNTEYIWFHWDFEKPITVSSFHISNDRTQKDNWYDATMIFTSANLKPNDDGFDDVLTNALAKIPITCPSYNSADPPRCTVSSSWFDINPPVQAQYAILQYHETSLKNAGLANWDSVDKNTLYLYAPIFQTNCINDPPFECQYGDCAACSHNFFKTDVSYKGCTQCQQNAQSPIASTEEAACKCNRGFQQDGPSTCVECVAGKYSDNYDADGLDALNCTACDNYTFTPNTPADDVDHCTVCSLCGQNEFWASGCDVPDENVDAVCTACPPGLAGSLAATYDSFPVSMNPTVDSCICLPGVYYDYDPYVWPRQTDLTTSLTHTCADGICPVEPAGNDGRMWSNLQNVVDGTNANALSEGYSKCKEPNDCPIDCERSETCELELKAGFSIVFDEIVPIEQIRLEVMDYNLHDGPCESELWLFDDETEQPAYNTNGEAVKIPGWFCVDQITSSAVHEIPETFGWEGKRKADCTVSNNFFVFSNPPYSCFRGKPTFTPYDWRINPQYHPLPFSLESLGNGQLTFIWDLRPGQSAKQLRWKGGSRQNRKLRVVELRAFGPLKRPTYPACNYCRDGSFKPTYGNEPCTQCPSGTDTQPCFNQTSNCNEFSDCLCAAGFFFNGTACEKCGVGTAKATINNIPSCTDCLTNENSWNADGTQLITGVVQCTCDPGFFRVESTCQMCLPGTVKDVGGDQACSPCLEGTYQDEHGKTACKTCQANSASTPKLHRCTCNAGFENFNGTHYNSDGVLCQPCVDGQTFKSVNSPEKCAPCTELCATGLRFEALCNPTTDLTCQDCQDSNSDIPYQSLLEFCFCDAGYEFNGEVCVPCQAGEARADIDNNTIMCVDCVAGQTFTSQAAQSHCSSCDSDCGEVNRDGDGVLHFVQYVTAECSVTSQIVCTDCQLCLPGRYESVPCGSNDNRNDTVCAVCPAGFFCPGQSPIIYDFSPYNNLQSWKSYAVSIGGESNFLSFKHGGIYLTGNDVGYFELTLPRVRGTLTVIYYNPFYQGTVQLFVNGEVKQSASAGESKTYTQVIGDGEVLRIEEIGASVIGEDLQIIIQRDGTVGLLPCQDNSDSLPGSTELDDCKCDSGYFAITNLPATKTCQKCGFDNYCFDDAIFPCPNHSFTHTSYSSHILDCQCRRGHHRVFNHDEASFMLNEISSFTCPRCAPGDWCFNNSAYNCSDDRMRAEYPSFRKSNCTCEDGFYNDDTDTTCILCPPDSYCAHGLRYNCSVERWTQGQSGEDSPEACLCRPGLQEVEGICSACPANTYCDGDNVTRACHGNSTSGLASVAVSSCLCNAGFQPRSGQCEACSPNFVKETLGNFDCEECRLCETGEYVSVTCTSRQQAHCEPCTACRLGKNYTFIDCSHFHDTVCKPCTECDYTDQFLHQACTTQTDAECRNITRNVCPDAGKFRGGHTNVTDSFCATCLSLQIPYYGYRLDRFSTPGLAYNDPYSCESECLGASVFRRPGNFSLGCRSCENGNFLFRHFTTNAEQTQCQFTCRSAYQLSQDGSDCVVAPLPGDYSLRLDISAVTEGGGDGLPGGFIIRLMHSNHSRFAVLVGNSAPTGCASRGCCWGHMWRISTLAQMGHALPETCSQANPPASTTISPDTLDVFIPHTRLEELAACTGLASGGLNCTLTFTVIDVIRYRTLSRQVVIMQHRGAHMALVNRRHELIPLAAFDVLVLRAIDREDGTSVFSVLTAMTAGTRDLTVTVRARGMSGTTLTPAESDFCARAGHEAQRNASLHLHFNIAAGSSIQRLTHFVGSADRLDVFYTLQDSVNSEVVMDIAAARNVSGTYAICTARPLQIAYDPGAVWAAAGLGKEAVGRLQVINATSSVSSDALATSGAPGQLITFLAIGEVSTVKIRPVSVLLAYAQNASVAASFPSPVATMQSGHLDFQRKFRQHCLASSSCQYEYALANSALEVTFLLRNCSSREPTEARSWIARSFGTVHDAGHVNELCNRMTQMRTPAAALLVHTLRYRHARGTAWDTLHEPSVAPVHTLAFAHFAFEA